ncbi:MAG: hypothetical protein K2X93_07970 [Candidatus Obscuribacterales bacterium]|nr:hypothetical protein [Candidatus Obscuribacterales bacterium]
MTSVRGVESLLLFPQQHMPDTTKVSNIHRQEGTNVTQPQAVCLSTTALPDSASSAQTATQQDPPAGQAASAHRHSQTPAPAPLGPTWAGTTVEGRTDEGSAAER